MPGKCFDIAICFVLDPLKTGIGPMLLARALRIFDKLTQTIECEVCIFYMLHHLLHLSVICFTLGTFV